MARPKKYRKTFCDPTSTYFKPRGIPMWSLQEEALEKDEFEAIKLADFENLKHEDAAAKMQISRATFGRILRSARSKIADSIINGKAIKINK